MRDCQVPTFVTPCEARVFVAWIDALEVVAKAARDVDRLGERSEGFFARLALRNALVVLDRLILVGGRQNDESRQARMFADSGRGRARVDAIRA